MNQTMHAEVSRAYLNADVSTAIGSQLILRLYDKALCCLKLAEESIERGEAETKAKHLTRVLDIIHELTVSINLDCEPIATNLLSLYSYLSQRVLDGCLRNDMTALEEVTGILKDLRSAWEVAVQKYPAPPPVNGGATNAEMASARTGAE